MELQSEIVQEVVLPLSLVDEVTQRDPYENLIVTYLDDDDIKLLINLYGDCDDI